MSASRWRLSDLDRRWIFLVMAVAIVVPLYWPIGLPIAPSPMTSAAFSAVEELQAGDVVFVGMDLDPASTPELEPYYRAVILQLKRKNVKLVFATTWYAAPPLIERWLHSTVEAAIAPPGTPDYAGPPDRPYVRNVDYAYLGFREGKQSAIMAMAADLPKLFGGVTADGTPFANVPLLRDKKTLADFKLLVLVSAGAPGAKEYVQFAQARYALRMVAACTAVSTTDLSPYYQAGQLRGLVAGLSGAAEYEALVGKRGTATQGADVLNVGHGVVVLAIVLGNLAHFAERRRRRREARP